MAFGSAPGVPNWGGLLSRIRRAAQDTAHECFDVLYIVDPARSWYSGETRSGRFPPQQGEPRQLLLRSAEPTLRGSRR